MQKNNIFQKSGATFKKCATTEMPMKIYKKESNTTKAMIIEAFLQVLSKRNYHDITIAQIADKALLSRRTFYRHFVDKEALVDYLVTLLMDEFSRFLLENIKQDKHLDKGESTKAVAYSYFLFWEEYIDELLLLQEAKLAHVIGDNIEHYIYNIAKKIGHGDTNLTKEQEYALYEKYKYAFSYRLAGYWKVTLLWSQETPRKTPQEMSRIIKEIMFMEEK